MTIALGIDTGGTYTDAALVDYYHRTGPVLGQGPDHAPGPVDRHWRGHRRGLPACGAPDPAQVSLVALSTTLATNAIVEGQGSPVCLILIGYDPELIRQYGFEEELVTDDVVYIGGGHDIRGDEAAPLDEAALRQAILARKDRVEAFAVSGYFRRAQPGPRAARPRADPGADRAAGHLRARADHAASTRCGGRPRWRSTPGWCRCCAS